MSQVKEGNKVRLQYVAKLEDGTIFDKSAPEDPLEFKVGGGEILPAFEREVVGMSPGEKKAFTVDAGDAFGSHRPELVRQVERNALEVEGDALQVGARLQAMTDQSQMIELTVTEVTPETVTLDANHPLAGEDLHFEVQLLDLTEGSAA